MIKVSRKALVIGGGIAVAVLVGGYATAALAQDRQTPKGWSYEIRDGKRVPKSDRVTKSDGSWREEVGRAIASPSRNARRRAIIRKPASATRADRLAFFAGAGASFGRCLISQTGRPVPGISLQSRTWALPSGPVNTAQSRGLLAVGAARLPHVEILDTRRRSRRRSPGLHV